MRLTWYTSVTAELNCCVKDETYLDPGSIEITLDIICRTLMPSFTFDLSMAAGSTSDALNSASIPSLFYGLTLTNNNNRSFFLW